MVKSLGLSAGTGIVVIERPMWGGTWVERKKFEQRKRKRTKREINVKYTFEQRGRRGQKGK